MAQDLRGYLELLKRKRPDDLLIVSTPRHRVPPEVWERISLKDFLPRE